MAVVKKMIRLTWQILEKSLRPARHRPPEAGGAVQSDQKAMVFMRQGRSDCFAALAMTVLAPHYL
jgi:hypothetical protein